MNGINAEIMSIARTADVVENVEAMLSRVNEFSSPTMAMLAGIGVQQRTRRYMDEVLADRWAAPWSPPLTADEVVVGSGPHALIYAAVRAAKGVRVIMLEKSKWAGGSFACSKGPSFWLNSRNRPGDLGVPGQGLGLNVLPGCPIQPSMIGGGEYQTNEELAWVIRANLMMLGIEVHTGVKVKSIEPKGDGKDRKYRLILKGEGLLATFIDAKRVILATGLGDPAVGLSGSSKPDRLLTFTQFMAKMDDPFPLRGMNRVAVVGSGDSGKTAIEALLGQGPTTGMSVAALDYPETIDWYGCAYTTQDEWCAANRGRYNRIGAALKSRINPVPSSQVAANAGFESVQIGPKTYDWAIDCTGYQGVTKLDRDSRTGPYLINGRQVARRVIAPSSSGIDTDEVYSVGPAARIQISGTDQRAVPAFLQIPDNSASIFRYAPLTAALANDLPPLTKAI